MMDDMLTPTSDDSDPFYYKDPSIKTASPPKFSNIVIKSFHNAIIDLDVLFNILPIIKISPEKIEESEEDYNGVFISVRRFPKSRGYRGPSNIKSFLDFDFYFLDKNFHVKVSTNAVSVVGGGSMEKTKSLIETLYHHFIFLGEKWEKFSKLPPDVIRNTFSSIKDPKFLETSETSTDLYEFLDVIINKEDENIDERLADLFPLIGKKLYQQQPAMAPLINCNSVYNYRLPEEISLQEKSTLLYSKGYQIVFHNFAIVKCFKAVWNCPTTGNKFSFSIQNVGTIKQNSAHSHEESIKMYEKIITDLGFLPYFEGASFAVKKKPVLTEAAVKSSISFQILNKYLLAD